MYHTILFSLLYRLDKWAVTKCILGTFFDFQDMLRDTFLVTKLIASAAAFSMMSGESSYTFTDLVRLLLIYYTMYSIVLTLSNYIGLILC
jgi:hypothetical protein